MFLLSSFSLLSSNSPLNFSVLKDDLLAAQADAQSSRAQLEGEVALTSRLRTAINDLSTSWELEPADELREVDRGDALVNQLCYLGATLRDRVRDALHTGVKRAMAVVSSGFSYIWRWCPMLRHRHRQD